MTGNFCEHIQAVDNTTLYPDEVPLNEDCLRELGFEDQKMLSIEKIQDCIELNNLAQHESAIPAVAIEDKQCFHLSLYLTVKKPYSPLKNRAIVVFFQKIKTHGLFVFTFE